MKISQFTKAVGTTKETVRHYESMNLLSPGWEKSARIYTEKECEDFAAIKEMQGLGLPLKTIQTIFYIKRQKGCGSEGLVKEVKESLYRSLDHTSSEINRLSARKVKLLELVQTVEALSGKD